MNFRFDTKAGPFYIIEKNERFHIIHDSDDLGNYPTAQHAAEDLAGGHTFWPPSGIDPSELGIDEDISFWEVLND